MDDVWDGIGEHKPLRLYVALEDGASFPPRQYDGDAGFDLVSYIPDLSGYVINPHEFVDIATGVRIALPDGCWAEIRGRSSMAWKKRLIIHPGVIDEGYRGELRVLVQNLNTEPVTVEHGERLAQLIIHRRIIPAVVEVLLLPPSLDGRGERGFGSTGR